MKLKIKDSEYEIVIKKEDSKFSGQIINGGYFDNSSQKINGNNQIILYNQKIGSQTFWHEIAHAMFAILINSSDSRLANKVYHNERIIDSIADMIFQVNEQIKK